MKKQTADSESAVCSQMLVVWEIRKPYEIVLILYQSFQEMQLREKY